MAGPVRKSAVAGTWYPGDPTSIVAEVEEYLAAVRVSSPPGRLVALICPHAGLRYSGPVAAHAYALLRGRSGLTAVLVGPSHHMAFDGVAVAARGAFETPLGQVPIDEELAARLVSRSGKLTDEPRPHRAEHSLEMQLPFLQHLVPDLRIVPVLMGSQTREESALLADALVEALEGREALLIASSDLSHYHPAPEANALDALVVENVRRLDPDALMRRLEGFHGHACGGGPMVAVMKAAGGRGADRGTILKYGDSGDVAEGDKRQVVGYLAAALTAGGLGDAEHPPAQRASEGFTPERAKDMTGGPPVRGELTELDRRQLLVVARQAIAARLTLVPFALPDVPACLRVPGAAFVTLRRRGDDELRGCIGTLEPREALVEAVARMAVAAATQDLRFPPVSAEELPSIALEISILTPPIPIAPEDVEPGRHGLIIRHAGRSGLLLPQVATDHGWDRETFLQYTCLKAGLPPDGWKHPAAAVLCFTALVFGEE